MDNQTDDLMTLADAAKLLNCTRQNMSFLINKGVIPSQRLAGGAVVLVKRSDIENYAPHRRNRGGKAPQTHEAAHQQPKTEE